MCWNSHLHFKLNKHTITIIWRQHQPWHSVYKIILKREWYSQTSASFGESGAFVLICNLIYIQVEAFWKITAKVCIQVTAQQDCIQGNVFSKFFLLTYVEVLYKLAQQASAKVYLPIGNFHLNTLFCCVKLKWKCLYEKFRDF